MDFFCLLANRESKSNQEIRGREDSEVRILVALELFLWGHLEWLCLSTGGDG